MKDFNLENRCFVIGGVAVVIVVVYIIRLFTLHAQHFHKNLTATAICWSTTSLPMTSWW